MDEKSGDRVIKALVPLAENFGYVTVLEHSHQDAHRTHGVFSLI